MASFDNTSNQTQPGTDTLWHGTSNVEADNHVAQDTTTSSTAANAKEQAAGLAEAVKNSEVRNLSYVIRSSH